MHERLAKPLPETGLPDATVIDELVRDTDLRLRPDPASTPVAVSTEAALNYYGSVGQNWERAAMIKARVCAGDVKAGEDLLRQLAVQIIHRALGLFEHCERIALTRVFKLLLQRGVFRPQTFQLLRDFGHVLNLFIERLFSFIEFFNAVIYILTRSH